MHCGRPSSDFMAGAALCEPRTAALVAGAALCGHTHSSLDSSWFDAWARGPVKASLLALQGSSFTSLNLKRHRCPPLHHCHDCEDGRPKPEAPKTTTGTASAKQTSFEEALNREGGAQEEGTRMADLICNHTFVCPLHGGLRTKRRVRADGQSGQGGQWFFVMLEVSTVAHSAGSVRKA